MVFLRHGGAGSPDPPPSHARARAAVSCVGISRSPGGVRAGLLRGHRQLAYPNAMGVPGGPWIHPGRNSPLLRLDGLEPNQSLDLTLPGVTLSTSKKIPTKKHGGWLSVARAHFLCKRNHS